MKPLLVALVALMLTGCDDVHEDEYRNWTTRDAGGRIVSFADYKNLRLGMTIEEVEAQIGASGYRSRDYERTFIWVNWDGTGLRCYFENGKLTNKASIKNLW